ncbi:MAG: metallophosphoesterase family protein [Chloroflexi bacterium]|nr:metallophosphoesterase family protein [Chloroflexota bacterium]
MRIAIVADVHANLASFQAMLRHAEAGGSLDAIWCLGDTVGYGPQPNECLDLLRSYEHLAVAGNHDLAACGSMTVEEFNDAAAKAALWTEKQLTQSSREYLQSLPLVAQRDEFTLVHGSLREPEWEYLLSTSQARAQFALQETRYSIVGHSHMPFVCREVELAPPTLLFATDGERADLTEQRLILNPGSAGQPRDGDPRVGYALYDTDAATVTFARVEYDIAATQRAMKKAGLPRWLSDRLSEGL